MDIVIGDRVISRNLSRPFFIAEAGVNHGGEIEKAELMIDQAARAGIDAIKFQAYKADRLASRYAPSYWDLGKESASSQHELFKRYDSFGPDEYRTLAKRAERAGIMFLCTPFDEESARSLAPLLPAFKIASADISNTELLRCVGSIGKPVLLSTGAANVSEIWEAVEELSRCGAKEIVILHCVLEYPTRPAESNLGMISHLKRLFPDNLIGYSDHVPSERMMEILPLAWLLGASVIEKHFTYDKSLSGNDHYHSMDERDAFALVKHCERAMTYVGTCRKRCLEGESSSRLYARRSLVASRDISKGEKVNPEMISLKRPGTGLPPKFKDYVVGSIASSDVPEDTILGLHHFTFREEEKNEQGERRGSR